MRQAAMVGAGANTATKKEPDPMTGKDATYTHGHHESVLRSHTWRTAENSAGYLLGHLTPDMELLDVGCGPGTITADLTRLVKHVTAIDTGPEILATAKENAPRATFRTGDVHALDFP